MDVEMIATRHYIGLEGTINPGDPLTVSPARAKELIDLNVADYANQDQRGGVGGAERKPAGPAEQKPAAPANPGNSSGAAQAGRSTATASSRTRGGGAASASSEAALRSPARPRNGVARKSTRKVARSR
jgi:hypothetical protein